MYFLCDYLKTQPARELHKEGLTSHSPSVRGTGDGFVYLGHLVPYLGMHVGPEF